MEYVKFRVWDIENEVYIDSNNEDFCFIIKKGEVQVYYIDDDIMHKINHDKAGQYINLNDINGTEVYVGDTVKTHSHIGIINYIKGDYVIKYIDVDDLDYVSELNKFEVIQNALK